MKLHIIGHFAVMDGSEAGIDLVLIQTFLLYHVNQVILMLTSISITKQRRFVSKKVTVSLTFARGLGY